MLLFRSINDTYAKQFTYDITYDKLGILFKAKPNSDLVRFINSLKGATSRVIQNKFPEVKQKLWNKMFWSKSYCLITTGQVTLDQLKKYVENQGEPK